MKTYSFAKLQARWFPRMEEIANPFIYGNVGCVVNVSERKYPDELQKAFEGRGVRTVHLPLSETGGDMGIAKIVQAATVLEDADAEGVPAVVHCIGGNNRSRVVCECFHFRKYGFWLEDEYKGYRNHVFYNIASGHLPPLEDLETVLRGRKV